MFLAGYTFGGLSAPGNGSSDAILPIVQCHSTLACAGGETSFQCFQGYADTRCAHKASSQPAVWLTRHRLAPSAREPLQSSLLRGFGCRCGACNVGYYGLWRQCHDCGNRILVLFLSHAVPALTILGTTLFLFYGGKVDLPQWRIAAAQLRLHPRRRCFVTSWGGCPAAHAASRLLVLVPFLDTVSCLRKSHA